MIPDSYKVQDGCWNCVFMADNSDEETVAIFCAFNCKNVPKPICDVGSTEELDCLWDEWIKFSKGRRVRVSGICPNHKKMENAYPH